MPADRLEIDFPRSIERAFPREFPLAWRAVESTLAAIDGVDLSPLARRSPALRGYDWGAYLRCSVARMVRTLAALRRHLPNGGRVLDAGSYLGNFSLMLADAGFTVDATDTYRDYGPCLDRVTEALRGRGVTVLDSERDAQVADRATYDAVLAMGVIEHIPHTPRLFLEWLDRQLRPGGVLVIDTPNLAYLYTRQRLARGESIFAPLATQYYTELPFEGHHREYTRDEVAWMLNALGHDDVAVETFNYSYYALPYLAGDDLANHERMEADPTLREVILAVSRKKAATP